MKTHRSYTRWWRVVHLWGLSLMLLPVDLWAWYYLSVAVLEGVALARRKFGDTWSENVWAFLYKPEFGEPQWWKVVAVALWSLWFCGTFAVEKPWFGPGIDPPLAFLFLGWLWVHFFQDRKRRSVTWA